MLRAMARTASMSITRYKLSPHIFDKIDRRSREHGRWITGGLPLGVRYHSTKPHLVTDKISICPVRRGLLD